MRIDRVTMPRNVVMARELASDLDGDKIVDNQLGMIAGTLHGQITGFDLSAATSERLATDVAWSVAITRCDEDDVDVAIAPSNDVTAVVHMTGKIDAQNRVVARGDDGALPLSAMFDPDGTYGRPGWMRAHVSSIEATQLPDGRWEGRIAMGFSHDEVLEAITQPMAEYFTAHRLFLPEFDTSPRDGTITAHELKTNQFVSSLLAPDLEVGKELLLSLGIGFSGTAR